MSNKNKGAAKTNANAAADDYNAKLDKCVTDGIIKSGTGILLGALASTLFLRRRKWPVIAGMGAGMGHAYANCENELQKKAA